MNFSPPAFTVPNTTPVSPSGRSLIKQLVIMMFSSVASVGSPQSEKLSLEVTPVGRVIRQVHVSDDNVESERITVRFDVRLTWTGPAIPFYVTTVLVDDSDADHPLDDTDADLPVEVYADIEAYLVCLDDFPDYHNLPAGLAEIYNQLRNLLLTKFVRVALRKRR